VRATPSRRGGWALGPCARARASETSRRLAGQWTVESQAQEMLRIYQQIAQRRPLPQAG